MHALVRAEQDRVTSFRLVSLGMGRPEAIEPSVTWFSDGLRVILYVYFDYINLFDSFYHFVRFRSRVPRGTDKRFEVTPPTLGATGLVRITPSAQVACWVSTPLGVSFHRGWALEGLVPSAPVCCPGSGICSISAWFRSRVHGWCPVRVPISSSCTGRCTDPISSSGASGPISSPSRLIWSDKWSSLTAHEVQRLTIFLRLAW
jgi:hypothetical protein